jgi:hypothetical protein
MEQRYVHRVPHNKTITMVVVVVGIDLRSIQNFILLL